MTPKYQAPIPYDFEDIDGNIWPCGWIDTYNNFTRLINKATYKPQREFLLDQRHRFYVQCLEIKREAQQ